MPIPAFRADGWLPEGHHAADWEEISAIFGGGPNTQRRELLNRLLQWRDALRDKGMGGLLILNGSFISQKEHPGDVDALFIYDERSDAIIEADDDAALLISYNHAKSAGIGDIFVFSAIAVRDFPAFCNTAIFDKDKATKIPKGVLEVEI